MNSVSYYVLIIFYYVREFCPDDSGEEYRNVSANNSVGIL